MDYGRGYIIPFAKVDQAFLDTKGEFDIYEKMTYTLLSRFLNDQNGDVVFPSIDLLVELMGASKPTVIKALKGLETKKLIEIEKVKTKGINKRNVYHLKPYGKPVQTNVGKTEEEIPYKEIVEYLNEKAGKQFKYTTSATQKSINGRWTDGFRMGDFKHVIDVKSEEWVGTVWEKHLCPETLFRPSNFEKYRNQKPKKQKQPTFQPKEPQKRVGKVMTEEERKAMLADIGLEV